MDLPILRDFQLPHWLSIDDSSDANIQLHFFSDASEKGFGAVCYARYSFPDGRIHVSFVIAKNRGAPLKQLRVPRLELQGALLAVRLADTVKRELDLAISDTFWSDSKTMLHYISNESWRFHTFVANRVAEIQDHSETAQCRYVPTSDNPADDCTRGLDAAKITSHSRWIAGPRFLWFPEENWPENELKVTLSEDDAEVKKTVWSGLIANNEQVLPDRAKFSSWIKYHRVIAWMYRFIRNAQLPVDRRILSPLKAVEIIHAEQISVKRAQAESFLKDLESLNGKKELPSKSRLLSLHPYLDADGLIHVRGHLLHSRQPLVIR